MSELRASKSKINELSQTLSPWLFSWWMLFLLRPIEFLDFKSVRSEIKKPFWFWQHHCSLWLISVCSLSIEYQYAIYFYPFLDLQFFQLYNAYVLYRLSQDPQCKEWQVGHHYQTLNHTILRLGGIKLISL